jgi:hypothetical protein
LRFLIKTCHKTSRHNDLIKLTMDSKYRHVINSIDMTAIMSLHQEASSTQQGNNFTTGQSWGALRKAWKGYRIAKVQDDNAKMTEYASKIRKIQQELGISVASFPHLGIP